MSIAKPAGQLEVLQSEDDFIQSHIDSFFHDDLDKNEYQMTMPDGRTKHEGLDPLDQDTDGDSYSYGHEENGYETVYITDSEEEKTREINDADPLTAYKDDDGGWMDTDGDNIPDVIEAEPSRMDDSRFDDLPNIESIRRFKDDFNDTDDEEKQKIYDKTFNPYIEYQGKPLVKGLEVDGTYEASWDTGTGADVTIKVYDPSGIDHIYLSSEQESKTVHIDSSDVNDDGLIKKTIHLNTDTSDWVDGWDLDIEVVGNSGNVFEKTRDIDGVLDSIWDSLTKVANYFKDFGDWIWNKATGAASAAADTAGEMASSFASWAKDKVSSMFSSVVDPIVDGLEGWAEDIQSKMDNFFTKLSDWEDGDGDVDATMNAGTGLMMSFMKQQDKAEQVTDVLSKVMNYIKPFQKYLSPFGAIGVITDWIGEEFSHVGNVLDEAKNLFKDGVTKTTEAVLGFFDGIIDTEVDLDMELPTMEGLKNFYDAIGMSNSLIEGIMDGYENYFGSQDLNSIDSNSVGVIQILGMGLTALSFAQALGLGWSDGMAQGLYAGNLGLSLMSQIAVVFSGWAAGTQVGFMTLTSIPLLSLGLIFFGMKICKSGTNPYELGIVGGGTLIELITYVGTIKKAAPGG